MEDEGKFELLGRSVEVGNREDECVRRKWDVVAEVEETSAQWKFL